MKNHRNGTLFRMFMITLSIFGAFLISSVFCHTELKASRGGPEQKTKHFLLIGHRGAAGLAPENTLSAFNKAWNLGVDAVELDVHLTSDGKVVVHHDYQLRPQIARDSSGHWIEPGSRPILKNMTLSELKTYDVGRLKPYSSYERRYPDQKPSDGERIPTLQEVIRLQKSRNDFKTQLWIEIKTSPVKPGVSRSPETVVASILELIEREGFGRLARILSFDWRALRYVQTLSPGIPVVYLTSNAVRFDTIQPGRYGTSPWTAGFDIDDFEGSIPKLIKAAGGRFWAPRHNQITYRRLEEAHQMGIKVYVWTPDKKTDMVRLLEMGVDGIITNRPDILRVVLGRP